MMVDGEARPLAMGKYLLQFLGITLAIWIVLGLVVAFTSITLPNSMGVLAVMAALAPVAQSMARNEGRVLTRGERAKFALLGSLSITVLAAASWFADFALRGLRLPAGSQGPQLAAGEITPLVIALAAPIALVVGWLVIYFGLGFMVRGWVKKLEAEKS